MLKRKWKTWLACCLLLFMSIALIGCSGTESSQGKALELYQNLFAGLSDEEYAAYQEWQKSAQSTDEGLGIVSADPDALPEWLKERFESTTTPECFENIIGQTLFTVPVIAYEKGYTIETPQTKVTQTDNGYDISGTLSIKKDGSEQQADVSVSVQLDEDGRISFVDIYSLSNMITLLA